MDLSVFPPSENALQAFKLAFNNKSLIKCNADFNEYLKTQQLSYENVGSVLKTLLSIEDITSMDSYTKLMEQNVFLTVWGNDEKQKRTLYKIQLNRVDANAEDILKADLDELVLVPQASLIESPLPKELILAQMPHMHENLIGDARRRYVASVFKVKRHSVIIAYSNKIKLKTRYAAMIFRSTRIPMCIMYSALHRLSPEVRRYIFPLPKIEVLENENAQLPSIAVLINADIAKNSEQLQAVQQIVAGPSNHAPYIVFGPPGTGKTTTIVEAILQLTLRAGTRIIVTAGSNSACDTIALKICECIEKDARFENITEKERIILRLYSQARLKKGLKTVHPLVKKYSNSILTKFVKKCSFSTNLTNFVRYELDLNAYKIIVATLCVVGFISLKKPDICFTHVFIDEAAASMEPEALLGIVGIKDNSKRCHVILSGDHKQLGPVVMSHRAASLGLGQSLMERLMLNAVYKVDGDGNYDCTLQTRLRRNYRSHPEIVNIFNKLYYNGELIPLAPQQNVNRAENWSQLPDGKFPILFQATHGTKQRNPNSMSSFNQLEAQVVCWIVYDLLKNGLDTNGNGKVMQTDIGIISPYSAQCGLLESMLKQRGKDKVDVGTVESFQGREKQIIIVSMVASFVSPAFVSNPRRLNVLLSRAISLMILVGNPSCLAKKEDLDYIINQCKLHGNLVGKKHDNKNKQNKQMDNQGELETKFKDLYLNTTIVPAIAPGLVLETVVPSVSAPKMNKKKYNKNKKNTKKAANQPEMKNSPQPSVPTIVLESVTEAVVAAVPASTIPITAKSIRRSVNVRLLTSNFE